MIKSSKLDRAVRAFTSDMRTRLAEKEHLGYTGWDGAYPREDLIAEMMRDMAAIALKTTDKPTTTLVDIANRCMILHYRGKQKAAEHLRKERKPNRFMGNGYYNY